MHPDEVLNLTFREFLYLQKRRKESLYYGSHQVFSIYAAILNMTANLIHAMSAIASGKKGKKPKHVKAEDLIGTLDQFMKGEKASSTNDDSPDEIYSKMLMVFPDLEAIK